MKKALSLALALLMVAAMFAGCSQTEEVAGAETFTGTGDGFGGQIVATVTVEDGKITALDVEGASETAGIGDVAPSLSRDPQLFSGSVVSLDERYLSAVLSRLDRRHHSRSTAAYDRNSSVIFHLFVLISVPV